MTKSYKLKWRGHLATEQERRGAARGLALAGEHLLGEARKQVPIEETTLERSGDPSERPGALSLDESALKAAISFDTPYAVRQHEEMTWKHDAGRKAKYLEDPYNAEQGTIRDLIAAEIRRALQ